MAKPQWRRREQASLVHKCVLLCKSCKRLRMQWQKIVHHRVHKHHRAYPIQGAECASSQRRILEIQNRNRVDAPSAPTRVNARAQSTFALNAMANDRAHQRAMIVIIHMQKQADELRACKAEHQFHKDTSLSLPHLSAGTPFE